MGTSVRATDNAGQLADKGNEDRSQLNVFPTQQTIVSQSDSQSASTLNVASMPGSGDQEEGVMIYPGEGTAESPFIVDWVPEDPENPRNWTKARKWPLTFLVSLVLASSSDH